MSYNDKRHVWTFYVENERTVRDGRPFVAAIYDSHARDGTPWDYNASLRNIDRALAIGMIRAEEHHELRVELQRAVDRSS